MFTGKEEDYDIWETRFLGYMTIKDLNKTILPSTSERAYAELVLWLDETSLSIIMNDAKDRGRDALSLLRDHYRGSGKPRILTMYTNLCNLKYPYGEDLTEYISGAERLASNLKAAGETISDSDFWLLWL